MANKRFSFNYYEGEDCSVNIPDFDTIAEAKEFFDDCGIPYSTAIITEWETMKEEGYIYPEIVASANFDAVVRDGVDSLETYVKF